MQWSDAENAGFTTGKPWLKVNPNYKEINAAQQRGDADSVFGCYKELIRLRKEYPVLIDGTFQMLLREDENIFAYIREDADYQLLVICNFYGQTVRCSLEEPGGSYQLLISNYQETNHGMILQPYEARMYLMRK